MAAQQAQTGVVARILRDKGFGFIRDEQTGEEFFFHRSAVDRNGFDTLVEEETRVSFQAGQGPKGPRAEQVRAI